MSRETQMRSQFYSWITKGRWKALLDWFNANEPTVQNWTILFEQANRAGVEKHWDNVVEFFNNHLEAQTFKSQPLVYHANAQERFWKTLDAALPGFFVKAIPLLGQEKKSVFRQHLVKAYTPWLPTQDTYMLRGHRNWASPLFSTLILLDAFEEWQRIVPLARDINVLDLLRHVRGQPAQWAEHLHSMHQARQGTTVEWRQGLLRADCIEHLLREPCSLPVTRTLLEMAIADRAGISQQDPCKRLYIRYPYLRIWSDTATGDDAQSCRALLELPEFETPLSALGQSVAIGRHLGLPLMEILPLLDGPPVATLDTPIDSHVFSDLGPQ